MVLYKNSNYIFEGIVMRPFAPARHAQSIPRSGIRDVFDRADRVPGAISLCVGEPRHTAPDHVVDAACAAIRAGHTTYTNILGIDAFRGAAADYTTRVKGLAYDPSTEIQAVEGATLGLFLALKAVVDPGDEVIIPSPFFSSYEAEVLMCGGVPRMVVLDPRHDMHLNAADIENAVTDRTRAIIINSPGNPTWAVTSARELEDVAEVCLRHGIWAISDEVYHRFSFVPGMPTAPSIAAARGMRERTIIVDSLSKTFAMTGWRIGYILAPKTIIEQTSKIAELMHSSVNSMAQYAGTAALNGCDDAIGEMRAEYERSRALITRTVGRTPSLGLVPAEGAFYAFIDIRATGLDSETFSGRLLDECAVAVVPGTAFGREGAGFIRVSYAGDEHELHEAMDRLTRFAEEHASHPVPDAMDEDALGMTA